MSQAQRSQVQYQLRQRAQAPANAQGKSAQSVPRANAAQQTPTGPSREPQDAKPKAFNLIIEGIGYLNRVRWVQVKRDPAYLCCTINAMMGVQGDVEFVAIDCRVVGHQAIEVVDMLSEAVEAKCKVIVGFRASDPKPDFYTVKDHKTGEPVDREGLKARLLQITLAKVDGARIDIPLVERPVPAGQQAGNEDPARHDIPQEEAAEQSSAPARHGDHEEAVDSVSEDQHVAA